jgi:electron transfer flavoprotein alpha subunit
MGEIFCLVEHRRGEIRDVTFEMLCKAKDLGEKLGADISAVLLGHQVSSFAERLSSYANRVLLVEDVRLANFNSALYQRVMSALMADRRPILTMVGNTAFGMDLAPSLAAELYLPLATDCIGLEVEDGKLFAVRSMYGGKVNAKVSFAEAQQYMVTVRAGAFPAEQGTLKGEVVSIDSPLTEEITQRKFVEYVEAEVGEVDITQADALVSVGRGIKEDKNMPLVEELANSLGGVLACSRPITDAGWLPKDRQVGQSGKTVKPKLYLAVGISGAFQHLAGMQGSDLIVAINKDSEAPIFNVANYGIVNDLFKVVPALNAKIKEIKG